MIKKGTSERIIVIRVDKKTNPSDNEGSERDTSRIRGDKKGIRGDKNKIREDKEDKNG